MCPGKEELIEHIPLSGLSHLTNCHGSKDHDANTIRLLGA